MTGGGGGGGAGGGGGGGGVGRKLFSYILSHENSRNDTL